MVHYTRRHDKALSENDQRAALESYHQNLICKMMEGGSQSRGTLSRMLERMSEPKFGPPFDMVCIMRDGIACESLTGRRPDLFTPWSSVDAVVIDGQGMRLRTSQDPGYIVLLHTINPKDLVDLQREWQISSAKGVIPGTVAFVVQQVASHPGIVTGQSSLGWRAVKGATGFAVVIAGILIGSWLLDQRRPCRADAIAKVVTQQVDARLTKIQLGANVSGILGTMVLSAFGQDITAPDFRLFYKIHPATVISESDTAGSCVAVVDVSATASGRRLPATAYDVPFTARKIAAGSWSVSTDTTAFDK